MIAVALILGYVMGKMIEINMISMAVDDLSDKIQESVVKHMRAYDLHEPKIGEDYQKISHEIENYLLVSSIYRIKIWNKDMEIVWFNDEELVGKRFPDEKNVEKAFAGEIVTEVIGPDEISQKYKYKTEAKHLLEVYIPVQQQDGNNTVVFEVYENFGNYHASINNHKQMIWMYTLIGSAAIYTLLFGFVWRASKRIELQQREIAQVIQDWDETFNSMTDIITIHDSNHNLIRANKAAKEVLNLPDLNIHKSIKCFKSYHGADKPPKGCPSCDCFNSGEPASLELFEPYLNKYIYLSSIPKVNKDNQVIGLIHIARDITEQKASEEQKKKLESQLIQAHKMESIGNLAGGIAHDFNNIISVISGYSELALKNMEADNALRDHLLTIHAAGEKAAALTSELLAFSRKQPLEMKVSNMNSIINNISKILARLIGENIRINIDNHNATKNILCDKTQFEQVLLNLVVNARDAMPNGGHINIKAFNIHFKKTLTIENERIESGEYTVLSVQDTGHGMSKEVQENIFEPFFSTKEVGKGTGMGLATVFGIVKQHKGYITVHSKSGEGTIFKVYFPVTDREIEQDIAVSVTALNGNETILAVDDEPLLINLIVEMLEPLGYMVLVAHNGDEALQVCNDFNGRIDLLLTDVIMPGMNGRDLAKQFIVRRPDTKVVFMSGYTDDVIAQHGVLNDGVILVNKPLKCSVVTNKIREVLGTNMKKTDEQSAHEKLNGRNILLADDNDDIRKLLQVYMKDYECNIDIAENGKVAVDKFKLGKYDWVLMDMQMPIMDGHNATEEIRKWEDETGINQTIIIALTGNAAKEEIDKCLNAGCSSHLAKPIKKDTLVNALIVNMPGEENDACNKDEMQEERFIAHVDKDLKDLIPEYLQERQSDINKIQEAMKAQDYQTVRILGHTLKGSGGGYGFDPITELGLHIEDAAKEKNSKDIEKYINQMSDYLENVQIIYE